MVYMRSPSTWEAKVNRLGVQVHTQLLKELKEPKLYETLS